MSKRLSISILTIVILFAGICLYLTTKLQFSYDFDHFFPQNDPDLNYFLEFRDQFENDNDHILIALENREGIFDTAFLNKVHDFTMAIEEFDQVESVLSPTNIKQPIFNAFGYMEVPLLHPNVPEKFKHDSIRITNSKEYLNTFVANDFKSLCLVVNNTQFISKKEADALLQQLETLIASYAFDDVHYAGKIRGQSTYLNLMQQEFIVFFLCSLLLIVLFLIISFRSWFGVIVPILTVLVAIIGTLGIMQFFHQSLDIMSTLLPTILFVVGMSDVVHILNKYIEELRNGKEKYIAVKNTFKEIGSATLLTSITTAIGFATLTMTPIGPIRNFAIYAAIGVILAFVIAILLLPALLTLIKPPKIAQLNTALWDKTLRKGFLWSIKNPKTIIVTYLLLMLLSVVGIMQLDINTYLLEDLAEDNPLQQDFRFFEEKYSGVRPFEMGISVKDSSTIFDYKVIKEIDKIENYLYDHYDAGFIWSPSSIIKMANKANHSGNSNYYSVPSTEKQYEKLVNKLGMVNLKRKSKDLVAEDQKQCRVTGKMDDLGSKKVAQLNEKFTAFYETEIDTALIDCRLTGTSLLIDKNNQFLTKNILNGLVLAFVLIAIILGSLFKSVKIGVISLIPNVIPLAIIGGLMGFFNVNINMSTSIVFTIAFGIAVDDTIHFFSKFRLEKRKGLSFLYALKRTYLSTGKAIALTSMILCAGFLSLILSDFKSTFLIGLYISLTLLLAVVTDLLLLPALLAINQRKGTTK